MNAYCYHLISGGGLMPKGEAFPAVYHTSPDIPFGFPVIECLAVVKSVDDALKLIWTLEKRDIYNSVARGIAPSHISPTKG